MRSRHLPQSNHRTGLAKEGFAAEVCGLSFLVSGGKDQKGFVKPGSANILACLVSLPATLFKPPLAQARSRFWENPVTKPDTGRVSDRQDMYTKQRNKATCLPLPSGTQIG